MLNMIKKLILERKHEQETTNLIFESNQDTIDDLITTSDEEDSNDKAIVDAIDDESDSTQVPEENEPFDMDDDVDLMNVEVNLASNTITDTIPPTPDNAPSAVYNAPDDNSSDGSSEDIEDIDVDSHPGDDVDVDEIEVDDKSITESVSTNDPVFKYYGDYLRKIQSELHNIFDDVIKDDKFKSIFDNKELVKEIHKIGKSDAYANNECITIFNGAQVYEEDQNAIPLIAKALTEVSKQYVNSHSDTKNVFKLSSSGWIDESDQIPGIAICLNVPKNVELNLNGEVKKFAVSYANNKYADLTASILGLNLLAQKEKIDFTLSGDAKIVVKEGNILQIGDKEIRIDKILTPSIFTRIANKIFKESVDDSTGDIFTEEIVFGDEDSSDDKKDGSSDKAKDDDEEKKDDSKEDNTVTKQVKDEVSDGENKEGSIEDLNIDDDDPSDSDNDTSSTDDVSDMDIDDSSDSNDTTKDDDIIDDDLPDVDDDANGSIKEKDTEVLDRLSSVTQELEEIKKNLYANMSK